MYPGQPRLFSLVGALTFDMKIKGGYILQPRRVDDSDIMHDSPITRELWFYLIRKVNFYDGDKYKRGSGYFTLSDIANDLHWYVGFRKMKYSKSQLTKALRRLHERNMIETTKEIRGVSVTICNYDYYQTLENYEGNNEGKAKDTRRSNGVITISERSIKNKEKKLYTSSNDDIYIKEISKFYLDQVNSAKSILEKHPEAKAEVDAYKQFVLFLYDWKHKDKTDPSGQSMHNPLSNVLKLEKQLRFDQFVNHHRKANQLGIDMNEKLMAIDNKKGYTDKLTDLNKTLHTWIKPYSK